MRYLFNSRNAVRDADLSATNVVPSNVIYRTDEETKAGGGDVSVTGDYTGAADTTIDIEIVSDTIDGSPRISQPIFVGVGNGTMSDVAADNTVDAQEFVVTLENLGTETRTAYAPFQGVTLKAKNAGDPGNAIIITVDRSGLSKASTNYSLRNDLRQGTNEYDGDFWNFGAVLLTADGKIPHINPPPRISFGDDPQVYIPYKFFRDGAYVYGFSPSPVRDVAAGAAVYLVTGSYKVEVTDGTDTEDFESIVTLYDALNAIRATSELLVVDGPITVDYVPGGQAAVDLSVWTQSYITEITYDGGDVIKDAVLDIAVSTDAPTELLLVTCINSALFGSETWKVMGNVSGRLDDAQTGVAYNVGGYDFTIPPPSSAGAPSNSALISVDYAPANGHIDLPAVCFRDPRIGSAAKPGTWSFVWTARPAEDCDCRDGDYSGAPNFDCLGVVDTEGGVVSQQQIVRRLQEISTVQRNLVGSNTTAIPSQGFLTDSGDVNMVKTTAGILKRALDKLAGGTLNFPAWVTATEYADGATIQPSTPNGYRYGATIETLNQKATSGGTEPTWTTTIGATFADGSITWTCLGKLPLGMFDDAFTQWSAEMSLLAGVGSASAPNYPKWEASTPYALNDGVRPTAKNGHLFVVSDSSGAGNSGSTEPTWNTSGGTTADGDLTWQDTGAYWTASTAYAAGALVIPGTGIVMLCTGAGGTSGSTEPTWPSIAGITISDGSVTWHSTLVGSVPSSGGAVPKPEYYDRWNTIVTDVLAAAGVDSGNFDVASANGDGCWHDYGADHWWVNDGTGIPYLPLQNGVYNYSCKSSLDSDGNPVINSTHEWGFGIQVACPEKLVEGDRITVVVEGGSANSGGGGYQNGDQFGIAVIHATPLQFGGGQTGDDTQTWSVIGTLPDGSTNALSNYSLLTTAPIGYDDGGLSFLITPGQIDFTLGDVFRFSVEGGKFHWRQNGGAWSADTDIDSTVSLASGLMANFAGGSAPSWVAGDLWSFAAEATNGVGGIRSPDDARMLWTGSTAIAITPADGAVDGIQIGDHTIPAGATITLQGSNDNFSTHTDVVLPWYAGHIWAKLDMDFAKYRLLIDKGGSIQWLFLGQTFQPTLPTNLAELGKLTARSRMPNPSRRRGIGVDVEHTALSWASAAEFNDLVLQACDEEGGRYGIALHDSLPDSAIVTTNGDTIERDDTASAGLQAADPAKMLISMKMTLDPIA